MIVMSQKKKKKKYNLFIDRYVLNKPYNCVDWHELFIKVM